MALTVDAYDLLVLRGFEALRREIDEAEQYTAQHYTQIINAQKASEEKKKEEQSNNQSKAAKDTKSK